jgi:hypothetical protein
MAGSGGAKAGAGGASGAGAGGSATGGSGGGGPAPGSCAGATGIRLTGLYHPTGEVISIDIEFFSDNVAIPVNELTVRYFITQEEDSPWRDMLYYSRIFQPPDPTPKGLGFDQVWQTLTPPLAYADTYLDLRFRGSLVLRPGDTGHVHFEIHPTSWDPPNQDQLDDWSFIIASPRMPWPNIVVLRNGELVWGCMPRAL